MAPTTFALHVLSFVGPAAVVALVMATASNWLWRKGSVRWSFSQRWAVQFGVGLLIWVGGLVLQGVDGKMLTYVALVLGCGTVQWLMARTSQRGR